MRGDGRTEGWKTTTKAAVHFDVPTLPYPGYKNTLSAASIRERPIYNAA
jgi:hypothetical protein